MTATVPNDLARALRAFFADHLPRVRGTSPHTIRSYRDSLVLLLRFVATRLQRSVIQLDLDDLGPQPVLAFVTISQWLGHASVTTTHRYATVDLDMKRQALAKARPTTRATAGPALWRTDSSVLEWLEAL